MVVTPVTGGHARDVKFGSNRLGEAAAECVESTVAVSLGLP